MERKILEFLRQNGRSKAQTISEAVKQNKSMVNRHLYRLQTLNHVFRTKGNPPLWDLTEKMNAIKPEQKSQMRNIQIESRVQDCRLASDSEFSKSIEMITQIAKGGYGCIYKVKHKLDGKFYALKQVKLTGKADSEVKALAELDHPNIVRYITSWLGPDIWMSNQDRNTSGPSSDVVTFERAGCEETDYSDDDNEDDDDDDDDDDDNNTSGMESLGATTDESSVQDCRLTSDSDSRTYLFIQMEFCEGGTLTDWIQAKNDLKKFITTVEINEIFYEIITGVEFIHANNLIHRDLKPDNILFRADGKVKIGDFGLVAAQTDQNGDPIKRSKRKGTPTYRSPEQENERKYDEKTDIFPLGLIWFEMQWKISTGSERAELWPDLRSQRFPAGFSDKYPTEEQIIKKMLSCTPEHRPHAKDIKEKLDMFFSLEEHLKFLSLR
ncbi:eukaryotic translation initiation factor 2-alpha kinase 3-like [Labeo rohita]|uniref:eukaryotic translation initiation factor 2-alpha kinase 3-like n=1 Tax=Labeo rohita TaxID=84645 RepID=UPI0021E1FA9E|nr:eukaryotic translation initiation factor 2-alpha kinase 3-like [Labeo rohita]